ncbi:MAG: SPOR domain-containing protein [Lentimicrobiaceae bacterium]|nr:SPOR domain-containing protein [Lentimicrobiaceae bacterium]
MTAERIDMEKYIKDYLLKYNRVQVSGFGVLEAVYKASYIHPILHTFSVPGKYVVFAENKGQDDDFAFFVAKKEKIAIEEAKNRIENWVQEVWETVKEDKKQFAVSTLGSFFINLMGRIEFASALDTDISPQSFGLEEFKAALPKPAVEKVPEPLKTGEVAKPKQEEVTVAKEEPKTVEINAIEENSGKEEKNADLQPKKKKKRVGLWIFLIFLLVCTLFVGGVYFAFPETFDTYKNKTLELFDDLKAKLTQNEADNTTAETDDATETVTENEEKPIESEQIETFSEPSQEQTQTTISANTTHYYVIIGSFRENTNADKFLKQKQANYSDVVNLGIGKSGYYMVGIGPYSEQDAQIKQKEISNAWILKE